eukprot:9130529-Alexandrium_andersonii.AAC.1
MAASSSASWEGGVGHTWEQPGYGDSDSDDDPDPMRDPVAAADEFMRILLDLFFESRVSARHVCEMCFWAEKAGMAGAVRDYAQKPGSSNSGNYQRHLDRVLGFDEERRDAYQLSCPGHPRGQAMGRQSMSIPMRPPHELLQAELEQDPSI